MADLADPVGRARLALRLLAADPGGLGGIVLRARSGPVRDALIAEVPRHFGPAPRITPTLPEDALFGGLDVAATLASGRAVLRDGLLQTARTLIVAMAERMPVSMAAAIALRLEGGGPCIIALDEGVEAEDTVPAALSERLAFHVDLDGASLRDLDTGPMPDGRAGPVPRAGEAELRAVATLCARLGIQSARAAIFALRSAEVHAALEGRKAVETADLEVAAALVLAHRATILPVEDPEPPPEPPPEADPPDRDENLDLPDELLLEAVRALVPDDLLARLGAARARAAKGRGAGAKVKGQRRGRPLPSRPGRPDGAARVDLVATLRAAAPWQRLRSEASPGRAGPHLRLSDIRIRRHEDRTERLVLFAVDASGSAAIARLGEAKGAVELLLGQAYARRDHVALLAFRGTKAELLLPPTRSLVRTKRRLAGLPGGGGTPLAAGLKAALDLALLSRRKGMSPVLALLTDGRANIALDGTADRLAAAEDALRTGRALFAAGVESIVIDTGARPERQLRTLAQAMDATYLPLPRANAERLSDAVAAALD